VLGSSEQGRITVCPLPRGECRQLEQGSSPSWSADGSHIYFGKGRRAAGDPELRANEIWVMT
jgi:hypothetical protein